MTKLLYGYQVKDGQIVPNPLQEGKVRELFEGYLGGRSIREAGKGIPRSPAALGNMLSESSYLGEKGYPALIDQETFQKVRQERARRNAAAGIVPRRPGKAPAPVQERFIWEGTSTAGEEETARQRTQRVFAAIRPDPDGRPRATWAEGARAREALGLSGVEARREGGE